MREGEGKENEGKRSKEEGGVRGGICMHAHTHGHTHACIRLVCVTPHTHAYTHHVCVRQL